jgi:phosphatidylglycerophosphate synthase
MVFVIFARDFALTWMRIQAAKSGRNFVTSWLAKFKTTVQLTAIITIIGVWCIYVVAREFGVWPPAIPEEWLIMLFNGLIAITMIFALVSWFQYLRRSAA